MSGFANQVTNDPHGHKDSFDAMINQRDITELPKWILKQ